MWLILRITVECMFHREDFMACGIFYMRRIPPHEVRQLRREMRQAILLRLFLWIPPIVPITRVEGGLQMVTIQRLLYREYRRKRYVMPNFQEMHFSPYVEQQGAATFGIFYRATDECVGTISVAPDGERGIAIAEAFPTELQAMRDRQRKVVEFTLLALNGDTLGRHQHCLSSVRKFFALFSLFEAAYYHARDGLGADDIAIVINPRTRAIYDFIGLAQLAPDREYAAACGKKGVPMVLSIAKFERGDSPFSAIYRRHIDRRRGWYQFGTTSKANDNPPIPETFAAATQLAERRH